jgi:hypothetical protein
MRISLARNRVGPFAFRSSPSGEPGDGQIETSPKEMYRTALPNKARTEFREDVVSQQQDAPEAGDILAVVRGVLRIEIKSNRVGQFDRHMPDFYFDTEPRQCGHEFFVEIRHRARRQRNCFARTFAGLYDELVLDKIEFHFEHSPLIRDGGARKPARVDVERHLPPVIDQRAQRQADFADDLCPHVQRGVGVLPGFERQCRPGFRLVGEIVGADKRLLDT